LHAVGEAQLAENILNAGHYGTISDKFGEGTKQIRYARGFLSHNAQGHGNFLTVARVVTGLYKKEMSMNSPQTTNNPQTSARDVNTEHQDNLSKLDRLALAITNRIGTMGFFMAIVAWTVLWLGWNFLAPKNLQFDPPMGFIFWLFLSNMLQIFLMPLLMIGQNLQGRHSERRAQSDFEVNVKAEQEIETILHHLEYQNTILQAMVEKLQINVSELRQGVHDQK
jgi:uncharacterized membrane protein